MHTKEITFGICIRKLNNNSIFKIFKLHYEKYSEYFTNRIEKKIKVKFG